MYDYIEFYSDKTLQEWMEKFLQVDSDILTLPGIPFNRQEISREMIRRDYLKA